MFTPSLTRPVRVVVHFTLACLVGTAVATVLSILMYGCGHNRAVTKPQPQTWPPVVSTSEPPVVVTSKRSSRLVYGGDYIFRPVYFDYDKYNIRDDQRPVLDETVHVMMGTHRWMIEGYCDERGTHEYNLALGQRRADSVRKYLLSWGMYADSLQTVSHGKERAVDLGHDEAAWSKNRRVEFKNWP